MKKIYAVGILTILCGCLISCDGSKKLAVQLQGTWSGAPSRLVDEYANAASYIPVYSFTKDNDKNGGSVYMNALITTTEPIDNKGIISHYNLSASGQATISGSWVATDDDEVSLIMDLSTLQVSVDPEGVILSSDSFSEEIQPTLDSIKPHIVSTLQIQMANAIRTKLINTTKFDDIKIKNDLMTCEINDTDYTFKRDTMPL